MSVFSSKLDRLAETANLAIGMNTAPLAASLSSGCNRLAVAVGSGGSLVSADYLAVCRRSLQAAPTLVHTPMEFILANEDITQADVWLFSARGENPDIKGAYRAAIKRQAGRIFIVSWNGESALAREARGVAKVEIHLVPIADKDAFLATHSLVSVLVALLRASNACAKPSEPTGLDAVIASAAASRTGSEFRASLASQFKMSKTSDALLILADPRMSAMATVIETSLWEAAICSVQWTDYRNFAHGRNVWLTLHPDRAIILSITGESTRAAWRDVEGLIPPDIRRVHFNYDDCGRFQNLLGVLDGLVIVEAMGVATGIDPGRPGVAEFATPLYYDATLERLADQLTPAPRR